MSPENNDYIETLLSDDLSFLLPLLRQYPKCYWIWNYRSWLLGESTRLLTTSASRKLWHQELGLDSKMLSLDSRNFHGWGYRRSIVKALESQELQSETKSETMTESEFQYTTKMIESNLSNFSAWHHRSKLIPRLLDERQADNEARLKMLDSGMSRKIGCFQEFTLTLPSPRARADRASIVYRSCRSIPVVLSPKPHVYLRSNVH